jgi:hypothetical protein
MLLSLSLADQVYPPLRGDEKRPSGVPSATRQ